MGARGPGARPKRKATKESDRSEPQARPLPWKKRGLSRLQRVIAFLEWLPVTKGMRAGKKMRLTDDQRVYLTKVYGSKADIRIAILSEPRGNGKTGLTAGIALCHLLGPESEPRGEVYAASVDRTMSGKLYNEMEAIIIAVPEFDDRVSCRRFHKQLEVLAGDGEGSVFEALSGDAKKGHGLAPSLWIYDELAQVPDPELLDNLETGMGKRDRSLGLIISTQAEDDDHRLSQMIDDGLSGVDPGIAVHLLAAPADADAFNEDVLRSVNPALGIFLNEKDLLADMAKARRLPAFEPRYRNRRLNQRVAANESLRLVTADVWKACGGMVDREALHGQRCYGGLDLSGKHDLTALVLYFPDEQTLLPFFWTPQGQLAERKKSEENLFKEWIAAGHIVSVPGPTIRSSWIAAELAKLSVEFDIRAIAYDRWRIDDLKQDLDDAGCEVTLEPRGQGFKDAAPDIEALSELLITGSLNHGNNPVLTACVTGAVLISDPAENLKFDKAKSRGPVRIDGIVGAAMAVGIASRASEEPMSFVESGVLMV